MPPAFLDHENQRPHAQGQEWGLRVHHIEGDGHGGAQEEDAGEDPAAVTRAQEGGQDHDAGGHNNAGESDDQPAARHISQAGE